MSTIRIRLAFDTNRYSAEWPDQHLDFDPAAAGPPSPLVLQVRAPQSRSLPFPLTPPSPLCPLLPFPSPTPVLLRPIP